TLNEPVNITIDGLAVVQRKPIARKAIPADDLMQAFAYHHLVPAQELKVAITGRAGMRMAKLDTGPGPIKIPLGGSARARFTLASGARNASPQFQYELDSPPDGIELGSSTFREGKAEIELRCDAAKAKLGLTGNLIIKVVSLGRQGTQRQQAGRTRPAIGYLPAVPFEVVRD
ncbi:MAG: hypothetical protein N3G20_07460, partial [Verrucomicrobiae bacterium]|nr:hypothetical protein [Verrucomicrobiae bacterium]